MQKTHGVDDSLASAVECMGLLCRPTDFCTCDFCTLCYRLLFLEKALQVPFSRNAHFKIDRGGQEPRHYFLGEGSGAMIGQTEHLHSAQCSARN